MNWLLNLLLPYNPRSEDWIEIPPTLETVTQDEMDVLLQRQHQARVFINTNVWASAMRARLKAHLNQRVKLRDRVVPIR